MTEHGVLSTYTNHGCRCDECKAANAIYHRRRRRERSESDVAPREHGTEATYVNYRCRCDACREARNAACKRRYHARKEVAA